LEKYNLKKPHQGRNPRRKRETEWERAEVWEQVRFECSLMCKLYSPEAVEIGLPRTMLKPLAISSRDCLSDYEWIKEWTYHTIKINQPDFMIYFLSGSWLIK
jgi:hypothetical protein